MKTTGSRKIAERYVKALFDAGAGASGAVEKDLDALARVFAESAEFRALVDNPLLSRDQQEKAMGVVLAKLKVDKITPPFIALLARRKRLALLPEIAAIYKEWAMRARGEMKATLVSASPLKDTDIQVIGTQLAKTYGKKILLEMHENPDLLGGLVLHIGGRQLDGSLAGKLNRLRNKLKTA